MPAVKKPHVLLHNRHMVRGAWPHLVLHPKRVVASAFDYPMIAVGSTANVQVMYDATDLGVADLANAQKVLARAEADYQILKTLFGGVQTAKLNVLISPLSPGDDGSNGAYHASCQATDLYVDSDTADAEGDKLTSALYIAEAVEVFSAAQAKGWNCGESAGEGLSRALAESMYEGVLDGYSTFGYWLDGPRGDWVSVTDPTDTNPDSTGCAVGFLTWLQSIVGSWAKITQAGGATLADTYAAVTGKTTAWADFSAACQARWPVGQPSGVLIDNPWAAAPPSPPPSPPPPPPPGPVPAPAGNVLVVTTDLPAGTYQIVADAGGNAQLPGWLAVALKANLMHK